MRQLIDNEDIRKWLERMVDQKAAKLLGLKRLTFEYPDPPEQIMKESLQASEINFWSWKTRLQVLSAVSIREFGRYENN